MSLGHLAMPKSNTAQAHLPHAQHTHIYNDGDMSRDTGTKTAVIWAIIYDKGVFFKTF